jgi:hypothetical protein
MSAIPSPMARVLPLSHRPRVESGKPIASVTNLRATPMRDPAPRKASIFTLPKEPEDAGITGGTRSLDRRLLALNFPASRPVTLAS